MIKIKQKKKTLPFDYHEVLLKYELELNKKTIELDLIRKLTYLYTVLIINIS
jgi:hypothetical protein